MNNQVKRYMGAVWEGPEHWSFHPPKFGVSHLPGTWLCSPTRMLSECHTSGIFWRLPHQGMINY